jgi:ATP adenylyltransferase
MTESPDSSLRQAWEIPGVPDAFQRLWVPHRIGYIHGNDGRKPGVCVFCVATELDDDENLVVFEGELAYVVLNLFPYNPGHLLVCPYRHIGSYDEATAEETSEMAALTQRAMVLLREVAGAHGFNIGMNQGRIAGAGIEEHLHQHVVPRWGQDSNFFPIIAKTKAMPQLLGDIRDQLRSAWSQPSE